MKELYWIDDDFVQMMFIAQGVISKLWNLEDDETEGVCSKIILFGNAYMEDERKWERSKLPSQEEEGKYYDNLFELYKDNCYSIEGPNQERPTFYNNIDLVHNTVNCLLKNEKSEDVEMFADISRAWMTEINGEEDTELKKKRIEQVKKLIERMRIKTGAVVGIDLSLIHGDVERIRNGQRVISMELYRQLKEDSFKCFLYSAQAGEYGFSEKWKQTYKKYSSVSEVLDVDLEDIKIYERTEFLHKDSEDIVCQLRQLLNI